MFSRTWHGMVPLNMKAAFEQYEYQTGVKDTLAIKGKRGVFLKNRRTRRLCPFFSLHKMGFNGQHDCLRRTGANDCRDLSRG